MLVVCSYLLILGAARWHSYACAHATLHRFEELNMDLFRKCMDPVEKTLRDAKMDKGQVTPSSNSHCMHAKKQERQAS